MITTLLLLYPFLTNLFTIDSIHMLINNAINKGNKAIINPLKNDIMHTKFNKYNTIRTKIKKNNMFFTVFIVITHIIFYKKLLFTLLIILSFNVVYLF